MRPRLYVVPASHPCAAAEAALRLKGIDYAVTEIPTGLHPAHQRLRFGERTVPSMRLDGEKISGSRAIMRRVDELRPEPPLYPADPAQRAAVEEADVWGDEVFQDVARHLALWSINRRREALPSFLAGARLPLPGWAAKASWPLIWQVEKRINDLSDTTVRADAAALPDHLDKIDAWIAEGVLGGEPPNAADLQIGSSIALLCTLGDVAPRIAGRPAAELGSRWFPDYAGSVPAGVLS